MTYQESINRVAELPLPWDILSNCNILITGATGLIGSCLVNILMARQPKDYCVYAMGRNRERLEKLFKDYLTDNHFKILIGDVSKSIDFETSFHYIVHAAGGATPAEFSMRPVEVMISNIVGVYNLMEYGRKHDLKRFLYISSGEVYGEGDGRIFTEEYSGFVDSMKSRSCYPSSKRASETLCVSYAAEYDVDVVIARPCHIYGPCFTENDDRVYAQFIRNVLREEDIVMKSDGSQFRSWCYVADCVSALLYILFKGKNCQAYNIANESSNISIKELAKLIADLAGRNVITIVPNTKEKQGFNVVTRSVFSTDKLEGLGWKPCVDIISGIETTLSELKTKN